MATGRPQKEIDKKIFENLCGLQCTLEEIAKVMGFTKRGVEKAVRRLRLAQRLRKVGGKRFGHWEVIG